MNFLAHLHLSGESQKLMVGNFIGDFVKGKDFENFDETISLGIQLHRAIDEYTDSHAMVSQSKDKLRKKYRHYSGVIVDMFYDHFLALNWDRFSDIPLPEFATHCYAVLDNHFEILPDRVQHMLPYMKSGNWLANYIHIEGLQKALNGMTRRTTFASKMNESTQELKQYHEVFNKEFLAFYPDLIEYANAWKNQHGL